VMDRWPAMRCASAMSGRSAWWLARQIG